jgi:hypothetical protein
MQDAVDAIDSFSRAAGSLERELSSVDEDAVVDLNKKMLKACNLLNGGLCRTGGILGEEAMFPGFLQYYEEFRKLDNAIEVLRSVKGSDMLPEIKSELVPVGSPEVRTVEFDIFDDLAALNVKRDSLARSLQNEVKRIAAAIREAEASIR